MNVNAVGTGAEVLKCESAILIYSGEQQRATASLHDVGPDPASGAPMLLPGKALTSEALNTIQRKLAGSEKKSRSLAPANLLCAESGRLIWFTPSQRRLIFFNTGKVDWNTEMNGRRVLHPALLFVAEGRTLYVFALASDERPTGKTRLFHAPYMNLYDRGSMCGGSIRPPSQPTVASIPAWEKMFFETNFSHTNRDARQLTSHPNGHDGLWRTMAKESGRGAYKTFPAQWLVPNKRKVEDLLNGKL